MRTSSSRSRFAPSGRTCALAHAQQLHLQRQRHIADLVEEQRAALLPPPSSPSRLLTAPVKAPWRPNSSDSSSWVQRAVVDGDESFCRRAGWPRGIACATTSLPVPLWPLIKTLTSDCATIFTCQQAQVSGLAVTMSLRRPRRRPGGRQRRAPRRWPTAHRDPPVW